MARYLQLLMMLMALLAPGVAQAAEPKENALDRIIRTGVIRCGYYVFPPVTYRDPNTGAMSGFTVDMMEELARRAALKVEWTQEITWANWVPELQAGRFDVACTPNWPDLASLRVVSFSESMFYAAIHPVVRKDDERFKNGATLDRLNQPDVTVLTQDGEALDSLIRETFTKAKIYALPASANGGEFYQSLIAKKADVALTDRNVLSSVQKTNPDSLKILDHTPPLKIQAFTLAVEKSQVELLNFLNGAIREMNNDGTIDRLLKKWEPEPGQTYQRVANPARLAE